MDRIMEFKQDDATELPAQKWLTETQKAYRLNVSVSYLQKNRRKARPEIPFRRFGRCIRYPAA